MKRTGYTIGLGSLLAATLALPAVAEWPERPIRVVVPFGAGGTADAVPRNFERAISEMDLLTQPMTILNVGGHFSVGSRRVLDATPDGYEFLVIHLALMGAEGMGTIDFSWQDYDPVALTGEICNLPTVSAESPYETLDDLMAATAENPDSVLAGVNLGGVNHMAMILLENTAPGASFRYVQVGGGTELFPALVGRHVDVGAHSSLEIATHTLDGNGEINPDAPIRALAYSGGERHPRLPHIPTANELGYEMNFCTNFWWLAPKGTPQEAIDGLASALEAAMGSERVLTYFDDNLFAPAFRRGDDFAAYLEDLWGVMEPLAAQAVQK